MVLRTLILTLLIGLNFNIYGQCDFIKPLAKNGFENLVQTQDSSGKIYIHYENRQYRFEGTALRRVLEVISEVNCAKTDISLIIYNKGIPITEIQTTKDLIDQLSNRLIKPEIFNKNSNFDFVKAKKPRNQTSQSSFRKTDIAVGARTDYLLGNFDNPIRWTPMLLPSVQSTLAKGILINTTYGAVLYDDLYNWEVSRFRYAFVSHNANLPGGIFTRLSLGYFEQTQFGVEGHVTKFFSEDKFRIDLNMSLTENRFLDSPPLRRAIDKSHFSYGIKATYRYIPWTTDLSLHYGRYIFDDTGYTLLIQRQFNEVFIGFFMREVDQQIIGSFGTLYDRNYGFQFTVPIGTKKHMKPSRVRVKTEEIFNLDYNYTGGVSIGRRIFAPGTVIHELEEYYPSTLKKALESEFK